MAASHPQGWISFAGPADWFAQFAAGLPNRDFLVAVSLGVDEMVDHVRSKVEDDYRQMEYPLTDELLLITPDGVTKLLPDWDC